MPADLCNLTPEQQQTIIIRRAILSMSVGAAIILIFSDPMVNVLVDLGNRTGVPAFYVSFLFAPLAGNIPEVRAIIACVHVSGCKPVRRIDGCLHLANAHMHTKYIRLI
jgi:hypothetical protein